LEIAVQGQSTNKKGGGKGGGKGGEKDVGGELLPEIIPGDANRDCIVNGTDLAIFEANFGLSNRTWEDGDFDADGDVDLADFGILRNAMGSECETGTEGGIQCDDHIDNDGDGYCDFAGRKARCDDGSQVGDIDCIDKDDDNESYVCVPTTEVCDDGIDNNCDGSVDEGCNSNRCDPFFKAVWSDDGDILAGEFDSSKYPSHVSVVPSSEGYALQATGDLGIHRYERVVRENLGSLQTWGGSVSVNLKDLAHYSYPEDMVFVGGYEYPGDWSTRDFAIAADMYNGRPYIYVMGYHNNDQARRFGIEYFSVSDAITSWPDRYITIKWYFTPSYNLFVSVDGSEWRETVIGSHKVNHEEIAIGWISSYSGGNVKVNNVELYNETCVPEWVITS